MHPKHLVGSSSIFISSYPCPPSHVSSSSSSFSRAVAGVPAAVGFVYSVSHGTLASIHAGGALPSDCEVDAAVAIAFVDATSALGLSPASLPSAAAAATPAPAPAEDFFF